MCKQVVASTYTMCKQDTASTYTMCKQALSNKNQPTRAASLHSIHRRLLLQLLKCPLLSSSPDKEDCRISRTSPQYFSRQNSNEDRDSTSLNTCSHNQCNSVVSLSLFCAAERTHVPRRPYFISNSIPNELGSMSTTSE